MAFTSMPCSRPAPRLSRNWDEARLFAGSARGRAASRRWSKRARGRQARTSEKAKAVAEFQLVVLIPGFGPRFPARGARNEQQACFDGITWSDHIERPASCRGHYERPDHGNRSSELLLFRWG